jgi:hypothetical protein
MLIIIGVAVEGLRLTMMSHLGLLLIIVTKKLFTQSFIATLSAVHFQMLIIEL